MTRYDAIIFDLDGTLVDSAADIHRGMLAALAEEGLPAIDSTDTRRFVGGGVVKLAERALRHLNVNRDAEAFSEVFLRHYQAIPDPATVVYPGVMELLASFNGTTMAICTNKAIRATHQVLEETDLAPHFPTVIGGGSTDHLKPHPAPLRETLSLARARRETTLFVGDSETDEAAALAVGLDFALFTGGYRKKQPSEFTCVTRFDHFNELGIWLNAER